MPLLAYLSFNDPEDLTRGDFARLALITKAGPSDALPYSAKELAHFEQHYCYDKFWDPEDNPALTSRYLCCGHAFVVVGKASQPFFVNAETGLLGQFRHQYFLVNLIAHFQKAALMLFSEWLVVAISQLDVRDLDSVRASSGKSAGSWPRSCASPNATGFTKSPIRRKSGICSDC
jgi:hypothetical protein